MAVLVFKADGDKEFFGDAEGFRTSPDGKTLFVHKVQDDTASLLAVFVEGGWHGVRHEGAPKQRPSKGITITNPKLAQTYTS